MAYRGAVLERIWRKSVGRQLEHAGALQNAVTELTGSNGVSPVATTCLHLLGASTVLMYTAIPKQAPIAGIAIGVSEVIDLLHAAAVTHGASKRMAVLWCQCVWVWS